MARTDATAALSAPPFRPICWRKVNGELHMGSQPKTALVTGGAKRIGAAIVADLAASGFAIAIHCNRSDAEAQALARSIEGNGGRAVVIEGDLTKDADREHLVARASSSLGPVGLVVNSASVFESDSPQDFDWDLWDRHFDLHLKAPVQLTRCFSEALPEGTDGCVVNVIDQRVLKPDPRFFSYSLSKAALWNATIRMAQGLAPRVRVNATGPGPALPNVRQSPDDFRRQAESIPLGRGPELAEFGRTVRYLFEARSVTGQMIAIDGGQHLAWETPDVTGSAE